MKNFLLIFSFLACLTTVFCTGSIQDEITIASDHVDFNGEKVTLTGHAEVNHELGVLVADSMVLESRSKKKGVLFDFLQMEGHVDILLGKGGRLSCSQAVIDQEARTGIFLSSPDQERVVYQEICLGKKGGEVPLVIESSKMQIRLSKENGDHLNKIDVDTIAAEGDVLINYDGYFHTTSDNALFKRDDPASKITLSGDVQIGQEGVIRLQAGNDVVLILTTIEGKKIPRGMETNGPTVLTYSNPETGFDHVLKSYGSLRVDHQKMETRLQSPENGNGQVIEGQQIFFQDAKGEIYADKAFIKYDYLDQKIIPVRIVLQGNVKMMNSLVKPKKDNIPINQYVLAERVDFIPQTKEMIFKAAKGKRVLLFDSTNNLEVSAPGLKLMRDKAARKETIQGIGDVRFSFVENEFDQLRRHFSTIKSRKENSIEK